MALSNLYYNVMTDDDREKIDIVLINGADGKPFTANLSSRNQRLPIQQDDDSETLFKSISNNDPAPKDDMALFDKEGRLIKYFEMQESYMGNQSNNQIRTWMLNVASSDYVNPCASTESDAGETETPMNNDGSPATTGDKTDQGDKMDKGDKTDKPGKEKKTKADKADKKGGKTPVEVVSRDVLVEMCTKDETSCSACGGKIKKGKCALKKKLSCRLFKTPEFCQASGCKYKKANVKRNKPMKCKGKLRQ